jgi:2-iminobutanoate/2-iminopropanoate deaminase
MICGVPRMAEPSFHAYPTALGFDAPYSRAVEAGRFIFLAGQVANDPPHYQAALPDDIESQTRLALENLAAALAECGLDLSHLVAVRIFLTRFAAEFERMNAVYRNCFPAGRLPARTCIGVTDLAGGARIEIDGIAWRG